MISTSSRNNYIYLEDNTTYGSKYWWHNGAQNKNQKTPRHGTQCVIQYPTNRNPAQSLLENVIIIIIIKRGRQCKAEREWYTPYKSEDPSPTIPPNRQEEEKGKTSRRL